MRLCLLKKADEGDSNAMCLLGFFYRTSRHGFEKDEKVAFGQLKKSADSNDIDGMFWAIDCLLRGEGVGKNAACEISLMTAAAKRNHYFVYPRLAYFYEYGFHGLPKDQALCDNWRAKRNGLDNQSYEYYRMTSDLLAKYKEVLEEIENL